VKTIVLRLPLRGTITDWGTFDGDPNDLIRPIGLEEFRDAWLATNGQPDGSWPLTIPAVDRGNGIRLRLAWIDYENGVGEYDVTAADIVIDDLQVEMLGKTPDDIADAHPTVSRMRKPADVTLEGRGKFSAGRTPPDDQDINLPNSF